MKSKHTCNDYCNNPCGLVHKCIHSCNTPCRVEDPKIVSPTSADLRKRIAPSLVADFTALYHERFSTDWKEQRIIREIELSVMQFNHLEALIAAEKRAAQIELLDRLVDLAKYNVLPPQVEMESPTLWEAHNKTIGLLVERVEGERARLDQEKENE
jgi:hypothetical protein